MAGLGQDGFRQYLVRAYSYRRGKRRIYVPAHFRVLRFKPKYPHLGKVSRTQRKFLRQMPRKGRHTTYALVNVLYVGTSPVSGRDGFKMRQLLKLGKKTRRELEKTGRGALLNAFGYTELAGKATLTSVVGFFAQKRTLREQKKAFKRSRNRKGHVGTTAKAIKARRKGVGRGYRRS